MSPSRNAARTLAAGLAAAALAAPSAPAEDLQSPDARTAAAGPARQRGDVLTGGARAPTLPTPHARHVATTVAPSSGARADAPTVVEVTPTRGFDWTSAAIGAAAGIALLVIALAGAATLTGRSRPAPH